MAFKKIGILGGMGPEASANFYYKIIKYCQEKYNAVQDTDYPPIVIYSYPLYGFDESGIIDYNLVLKQLIHGVNTLANAKCDFIVMPCNTIHFFIDVLSSKSPIPIISIVEETIKKIKEDNFNSVGLLASESTLKLKLYQKILNKNNIDCLLPDNKDYPKITKLILELMGGKVKDNTKNDVLYLIEKMQSKSIKAIVLGCTELPLVITQENVNIKIYDTLQILAEATVNYSIDGGLLLHENVNNIQPFK